METGQEKGVPQLLFKIHFELILNLTKLRGGAFRRQLGQESSTLTKGLVPYKKAKRTSPLPIVPFHLPDSENTGLLPSSR
jgi:hypothetical protein